MRGAKKNYFVPSDGSREHGLPTCTFTFGIHDRKESMLENSLIVRLLSYTLHKVT